MLTDADLTVIYKKANGEDTGKPQPLTTQRIFKAMRAIESAACEERDARIAELTRELEEARKDAERYRWLRDGSNWPAVFASHDAPEPLRGEDLDAAIKEEEK